jgi:hypothetical protein
MVVLSVDVLLVSVGSRGNNDCGQCVEGLGTTLGQAVAILANLVLMVIYLAMGWWLRRRPGFYMWIHVTFSIGIPLVASAVLLWRLLN